MLNRFAVLLWSLPLLCISALASPVFDYGSEWKYFIGTSEASSPVPTSWRIREFDDSSWVPAPAPIGYANPPNSPPEFNLATLLPSSQEGNYLSVFFRKKFSIKNPSSVGQLTLNVNIDDGYIVWLNGVEIGRYNVPDGALAYNAAAVSAIEATLIGTPITNDLSSVLVAGENLIAVQVFNANLTSSDLFFDAALESDLDETPPLVTDITPAPDSVVSELQTIEIIFSESVQGVDASDLLVNGSPALTLTAPSPRDYVFGFPSPPTGQVQIEWALRHGITDTSQAQNPFVGGSWTYTLDTTGRPPTVTISEFMSDNDNGIKDDDGVRSDWVELFNSGSEAANLGGWFLTDTTNNLTKWRIPSFPLSANGYLLIWASGKNRTNPAAQLHTNFKLDKDGGYLALVNPMTNVVSEFKSYPRQRANVSYGRDVLDSSITGYFNTPTPRARNSTSGSGFAPEPVFSKPEGVFTNSSIVVSITASSGQIRYTLDGSAPTTNSTIYSAPLTLSTTTAIKARVFQTGLFPSAIIAKSYILVDSTVANFKSKLPVMIISTSGHGIVDHPPAGTSRTFASIAAIDTFRGLSSPLGTPDYLGQCGISIRGQTSSGFPKKPYRLELQDAYGNDRNGDLFGLPAGSDWVLNNPYTDKPFLQNFLAYELFEKMGHYSVRRRFVEVFVNTASGKVSYPRDYVGVYILLEKIKVDSDRVPIERLTPYDTIEPNISGGYMFKKDKDSAGDVNFSTSGGAGFSAQALKIHEPNPREVTTAQLNWLANYLKQFEKALYATTWKTATGTNHYSYYMDVDSFVDQHWIVEFAKQIDGYRLSNYMQKDRNGKIKMEPIWDYNLSFGNADYLEGGNTSGWYWTQLGDNEHIWLRRLMCGTTSSSGTTGDPDFNQRIADRWSALRTNIFNSTNVLARVDDLAGLLNEAATRDFQKWPRLGTYVWPNSPMYVTPTTYAGIISAMKTFIQGRYRWIDTQFIVPPKLSLPSGRVPSGINVSVTGTSSIYYTLDGSDPRLPGGALSSKAVPYAGPVPISTNSLFFARSRSGAKWSGPSIASFITESARLIISEIMYHPAPLPEGSSYSTEDFEFLEFKNTGTSTLNLHGFSIADGVNFTFPNFILTSGARVLVVKNRAAFESRYGTGLPIVGEFQGQLDNSGERIVVSGPSQETILSFKFENGWEPITDGLGFALVLADETISTEKLGERSSWKAGVAFNGSPGRAELASLTFPAVVVNEALTRPETGTSAIELHNLSPTAADISGWFLTDNFEKPKKFRFPTPSLIPAGGFIVLSGDDFQGINALQTFSLDPLGEEVYLFSGDANTNLTGYFHGFTYGPQKANVTFGRFVTSVGSEQFVPQASSTLGRANSSPEAPAIVINTIMYRPPDVLLNGALWNNTEDEFIEIFNRSGASVSLFDSSHLTNTWRISGDAKFTFPPGTSIEAGGFLLLVSFDPVSNPAQLAAFQQKYQPPAGTKILGPYNGNLDNNKGSVRISFPDSPLLDGTVLYVELEQIEYQSSFPWPDGADGTGFALCRRDPAKFGNDPANWVATVPTAGGANSIQPSPVIIQNPASQSVLASQNVRLTVQATGLGTLRYQWRVDGRNILAANDSTLIITNAQPSQSGEYSVVVLSADASVTSGPATVIVGADNDRDGMDDNWELAHNLNPFDASDSAGDPDGDGITNLQEFMAGTDPRDGQSFFALNQIAVGAETVLRFEAKANHTYTLQYSDSLNPASWKKVADINSQLNDFTATVTDSVSESGRYYRLVTPIQP